MPSLSLRTAGRIAVRELRSSRAKFAFVVLSVAIGVAALTGVRGFSSSFRKELLLRARAILAADVSVRETQPLTPQETSSLDALSMQPGVERTDVTELLSMASAAGSQDPLLVALKAVDPQRYPFYGRVVLAPAMPLAQALGGENVVVADDLLLRLHLHLGDSIRLGNSTLRIVATVVEEPDRLSGMFAAGPRVLLSQQTLERSGLLVQGSHATRRYLFRLRGRDGLAAPEGVVATLKQELEAVIPEAQVADYREANPTVTKALDGATGLLSLMSLVAMVLGAVGVAMAMRAHLQQRMEAIAIMKSLGATSVQVMKIYLLQTLLLGAVGGVAGSLLGLGVQTVFPLFLERLLHLSPSFRVDPWTVLLGITAGLLTTLLFTLPPLLDIRGVRPIMILRRHVEGSEDPFAARMRGKLKSSGAQLVATVLLLAGLAAL
ncbi:MAG: ABC transporter permease, partial [Acidobacteriaceae bacterium]|nr:ABC transporter permease [Acidobacteriaceae bacterium]